MTTQPKSNLFTQKEWPAVGPPMIGALMRMPVDVVREHMLRRLHDHGFTDFEATHLIVFQYPGPHGARPFELAAHLRMSKQALNYLLGELEKRGYLQRQPARQGPGKQITLTKRGDTAAQVIRDSVREIEAVWAQQLGPKRFAQLHTLLTDLNTLI